MNTTPYFDEIELSVPLEKRLKLRVFAFIRLCLVGLALYICVFQLFRIGIWSANADRALIILGILSGMGIYVDGPELGWSKFGEKGIFAALLVLVATVLIWPFVREGLFWTFLILSIGAFNLVLLAYGLLHMIKDPLRTARFRQVVRYLRTLPASERRSKRQRLMREFQGLASEGFH